MSEELRQGVPVRPLDRALAGLASSVREREQEEKPIQVTLHKQTSPTISELYEEKEAVHRILQTWKAHAACAGKKEAVKECERIIAFIGKLCK